MRIVYFIKSETINLEKFTLKDPLGSSGRLDVIVRCAIAALTKNFKLEENIEFWAFLDNYGTFIFKSDSFNEDTFPVSELKFMRYFVDVILDVRNDDDNPLNKVEKSDLEILNAIKVKTESGYIPFILHENGSEISPKQFNNNSNYLFVIGNQTGYYIESSELKDAKIPMIKLGNTSYLASTVTKLIKIHLLSNFPQ